MARSLDTEFHPDFTQPPGEYLEDALESRGIRKADFATRCGRPAKTISEIISGTTAITPETALQFERVLDISASVWMALEAKHRLHLARARSKQDLRACVHWSQNFPVREMQQKGFLPFRTDPIEIVESLLNFFGVSTVKAWEDYWSDRVAAARFKQSTNISANSYSVAAWLRRGDAESYAIDCEDYDEAEFRAALGRARELTRKRWDSFRDELVQRCAKAGVAIALVPDLHKTCLRGAAYWRAKNRAVIILSDRMKYEHSFWFAFFHEAMHILLHSKKALFLDYDDKRGGEESAEETEADEAGANALISTQQLREFLALYGTRKDNYSSAVVEEYAKRISIDPSLLLARLQRDGFVDYKSFLNKTLKHKMEF